MNPESPRVLIIPASYFARDRTVGAGVFEGVTFAAANGAVAREVGRGDDEDA